MIRVNVSLKDEMLEEMDAEAAVSRINRSAVIQSALKWYLEARRKEREDVRIRREMEEACRGMDVRAEKLGPWDPVRVIREFRGGRSTRFRVLPKPHRAGTRMRRS